MRVAGILLAAGAGRRLGQPKALVRNDSGESWLLRAVVELGAAGCSPVIVVLGAAADEARLLLKPANTPQVRVLVAADWAQGMGASLRAGLAAAEDGTADAALITLVDLPDVDEWVHARLLAAAAADNSGGPGDAVLARAAYRGVPGHPVLIGRDHWAEAAAVAQGDRGARELFRRHRHRLVECGDLATGIDRDLPEASADGSSGR